MRARLSLPFLTLALLCAFLLWYESSPEATDRVPESSITPALETLPAAPQETEDALRSGPPDEVAGASTRTAVTARDEPGAQVHFRVTNEAGLAIAEALVLVADAEYEMYSGDPFPAQVWHGIELRGRIRSDQEGVAVLSGLPVHKDMGIAVFADGMCRRSKTFKTPGQDSALQLEDLVLVPGRQLRVYCATPQGDPIPGVELMLWVDYEEREGTLSELERVFAAFTDPAGVAAFDHLPAVTAELGCVDLAFLPSWPRTIVSATANEASLVLDPGAPVKGKISWEDGTPIEGAEVRVWPEQRAGFGQEPTGTISAFELIFDGHSVHDEQMRSPFRSDAEGEFALRGAPHQGMYCVSAFVEPWFFRASVWTQTGHPARVVIPRDPIVKGRVVAPGMPASALMVEFERVPQKSQDGEWIYPEEDQMYRDLKPLPVEVDGSFAYPLQKATWRMEVLFPGGKWTRDELVVVDGAEDLGEVVADLGSAIRVQVVDADTGLELEPQEWRYEVWSEDTGWFAEEGEWSWIPKGIEPQKTGRTLVWRIAEPGKHRFTVQRPGYLAGSTEVELEFLGQVVERSLRLSRSGEAVVAVRGLDGDLVPNRCVVLVAQDRLDDPAWEGRSTMSFLSGQQQACNTEEDGRARFPGLIPARYGVYLRNQDEEEGRSRYAKLEGPPLATLQVEPGKTVETSVNLTALAEICLVASEMSAPGAGWQAGIWKHDPGNGDRLPVNGDGVRDLKVQGETDDIGRFTRTGLEPGHYRVGVRKDAHSPWTLQGVDVVADRIEVPLHLAAGSISFRLLGPGGEPMEGHFVLGRENARPRRHADWDVPPTDSEGWFFLNEVLTGWVPPGGAGSVRHLMPGSYRLWLSSGNVGSPAAVLRTAPFTVAEGRVELGDLRLEATGLVKLRIAGKRAWDKERRYLDEFFYRLGEEEPFRSSLTGNDLADGFRLPAGDWVLRFLDDLVEVHSVTFVLPPGETVEVGTTLPEP